MSEPYKLTKMDIRAIKTADDFCFQYSDGEGCIRAIKRKPWNSTDPWAEDKEHRIPVNTRIGGYAREPNASLVIHGNDGIVVPGIHCFTMLGHFQPLTTILKLLRVGDELTLSWRVDGGRNGYLEQTNLYHDTLKLAVRRGENGEALVFDIAHSICPDNSARMIRGVQTKSTEEAAA